jgi:hypothetical protein
MSDDPRLNWRTTTTGTTGQYAQQWQQLSPGYLKCNVEVSFYDTTEAILDEGGVRDYQGRFILAGTNLITNTKLKTLERDAMAIKEAIEVIMV